MVLHGSTTAAQRGERSQALRACSGIRIGGQASHVCRDRSRRPPYGSPPSHPLLLRLLNMLMLIVAMTCTTKKHRVPSQKLILFAPARERALVEVAKESPLSLSRYSHAPPPLAPAGS